MSGEVIGRAAPQTQKLFDLATMEWQPLEPALCEAQKLIAPGKAMRKYNARRDRDEARRTTDVRKPELTDTEKIASGQRAYVRDSVGSLRTLGRIETKIEDGVEYFRRKVLELAEGEHCPTCGHAGPTLPSATTRSTTQPAKRKELAAVIELESWRQRSHDSLPGLAPWKPSTGSS